MILRTVTLLWFWELSISSFMHSSKCFWFVGLSASFPSSWVSAHWSSTWILPLWLEATPWNTAVNSDGKFSTFKLLCYVTGELLCFCVCKCIQKLNTHNNKQLTEEFYFLGYNAVQSAQSQVMYQSKMLIPSSGMKSKLALYASCFMVLSCFAYSSTLKMEARSSETMVEFQWTIWCYIKEYWTPVTNENLKSYKGTQELHQHSHKLCNNFTHTEEIAKIVELQKGKYRLTTSSLLNYIPETHLHWQ
jgi:hypothetical protein